MANKLKIDLPPLIISVVVILAGAAMIVWFFAVISSGSLTVPAGKTDLKIDETSYNRIVNPTRDSISTPLDSEDFGRPDPFGKY